MHNKGQMMSTDFLLALILVIFSVGIMLSIAELRTYEIKEEISYNALQEKAEAGTILLSSGGLTGCITNTGTVLPFSYDLTRNHNLTKENLGLTDVNVQLQIDGVPLINDELGNSKNILTINLDLIEECNNIEILAVDSKNTVEAILRVGK